MIALLALSVIAYAQQSGALVWNPNGSNTTINAPASSGTAFTYQLPSKTGNQTFAMLSDITTGPTPAPTPVPTPVGPPRYVGVVTLVNGTASVTLPTITTGCRVSSRSGIDPRYSLTGATWTFNGAPTDTVDYDCQ